MSIDWKTLPFDHAGRWEKKVDSLFAPGEKVTWPQFIAEMVIFWRSRYLKDFPKIEKGKGWSRPIQKIVRDLNQQAAVICNYFPHPDDEPLVVYAVKKYFRTHKPLKIGRVRKSRVTKTGGRERVNITQSEKDVVLGINAELMKVLETREVFNKATPSEPKKEPEKVTFAASTASKPKRGSLAYLVALEQQLKSSEAEAD
jgi:hypothetical protein